MGITQEGLEMSTTKNLDADVHFWRQVFLPLHKNLAISSTKSCSSARPPVKGHGLSVLTVSLTIIGLTFIITTFVYFGTAQVRGIRYKWVEV